MECPSDQNIIEKKPRSKHRTVNSLDYKLIERRPGYQVEIVSVASGCMRKGLPKLNRRIKKILEAEIGKDLERNAQDYLLRAKA